MTGAPHILSAAADMRGRYALPLIPKPGENGDEVMIFSDSLRHADAWTGSALRCVVEQHARVRSRRVVLGPPSTKTACNDLLALIGAQAPEDLPRHFCLSDDAEIPTVKVPTTVVLPAQRIEHYTVADALVEILPRRLKSFASPAAGMIEKGFGELVDNALGWGAASPVGAIATVAHERERHVLQVVVTDLGNEVTRSDTAADRLAEMAGESSDGNHGWSELITEAERRELEVELSVAAGNGRLIWRPGNVPESGTDQFVGGFTTVLEVQL